MPAIPYEYETHISLAIVINYTKQHAATLTATQLTVYPIYTKGLTPMNHSFRQDTASNRRLYSTNYAMDISGQLFAQLLVQTSQASTPCFRHSFLEKACQQFEHYRRLHCLSRL
jgi:hypothetical protein